MDAETVERLARLSQLELTEAEVTRARSELEGLLALFDSLRSVDVTAVTEAVAASGSATGPVDLALGAPVTAESAERSPHGRAGAAVRARTDAPDTPLEPSEVLRNAPARREDQFEVPRVVRR